MAFSSAPLPSKLDDLIIEIRHGRMSNTKAKSQILALIEEVIGEDDEQHVATDPDGFKLVFQANDERNELRAEMRLRKDNL